MSTKTSIRYFNALAAVCYDHNLLDDYDFSFQDMERNFNLCGRDDLIIILVKSTHVKTFLDVVSDVMPAQFERATALITGIVLSANGNTIAHEFANSRNRETDDSGSTYPFPYAMNLTCKNDIFTLCVVCAKSEQYEVLLDELIDDAAHLITRHGANLPVGYIPAHVLNNVPKKHSVRTNEDYSDLDDDVKEIIEKSSDSFHGTTEFESHNHAAGNPTTSPVNDTSDTVVFNFSQNTKPITLNGLHVMLNEALSRGSDKITFSGLSAIRNSIVSEGFKVTPMNEDQAVIPDVHTTGYIAPMEDDASYEPLTEDAVDVVDAPFTLDEESSNLLTGDSKLKRSFASLFSIEDDDSEELNVATIHPNDADSREVCRIVSNILTESQVNDIISRQTIDITNDIETVYDISRTVNKDYDPQVAVKFDNIHLLFTDLMHDLQKRVIHQEQHDNEFLLFDVANSLEDIRKNYFTDLRNMGALGIYRTVVADTELRAEWFLASITVDNYTDIIRLMFPRQYNGITTGYIKEFFEELLNNPTDNELYFALDNGFYKVKFVVANALHNPLLLARVECNFPVTPHGNDSKES